jgi:hypothetical protein
LRWVSRSQRQIARVLGERGFAVSQKLVGLLLRDLGYSCQAVEPLVELFVQVPALCRRAGLVRLGHVAVDGTKLRANASKHKAMNYGSDGSGRGRARRFPPIRLRSPGGASGARSSRMYSVSSTRRILVMRMLLSPSFCL